MGEYEPFDGYDWTDADPLMDAAQFSAWCRHHGHVDGIPLRRLNALAHEFCWLRGGCRPPGRSRLWTILKGAGWERARGPVVAREGVLQRETFYSLRTVRPVAVRRAA